jgi:hypothetical protein
MENTATQTSATNTPDQPATPPQLGLNDLAAVVQMIDVCSKRGAFEGPELASVGALRTRFVEFLKANQPKDQAPAPAAGGVETVPGDALPKA